MKRKLLILSLMLVAMATQVWAQERAVSGKVTSAEDGSGLPGVNILIKGTTTGTVTDLDGNFKISVPQGAVLEFRAIGLLTQEVEVGSRSVIDVQMAPDLKELAEVVVTAQGNVRQTKTIGYSTTQVDNAEVTKGRTADVMSSLQGKVAGLTISQNSGAPGASTRVILRGYSSIGGNNQPLYIVDGVPINNASNMNVFNPAGDDFNNTVDYGNRANDVSPDDIESITVLKSAAATALYGSRAANGVIVITTKRGATADKPKVELTTSATFTRPLKLPELQNEFGQGWNAQHVLDENGSWGPRLDGKDRLWGNVVDNSQQIKPFSAQPDNLKDFYETGYSLNNSIAISGGKDAATYYFSYGNISADGFLPTDKDKMDRHNIALRSTLKGKKLSSDVSLNFVKKDVSAVATGQGGNSTTMFQEIIQIPRDHSIVDMADYNNKFYNLDNFHTRYAQNPYFSLNENGNTLTEYRTYGKLSFKYQFTDWLSLSYRLGADVANSTLKQWSAVAITSPGSPNQSAQAIVGSVDEGNITARELDHSLLTDAFFNLNESLTLSVLAGANINERYGRTLTTQVVGLDIPGFYDIGNSPNTPFTGYAISLRRLIGAYAQTELSYKDYLFLNAAVRNDWSSTLPVDNRSFIYPSVNTSFVFTEALGINNSLLNFGKLRASWGQTGNDAAPYLINSNLVGSGIYNWFGTMQFPFDGVNAYEIGNQIGNPNLKPEITTEIEVGAEMKMFNNRLGLNVSYYDKRSDGQILQVPVASTSGFTLQLANVGLLQNKGIELLVNVTPFQTKNFRWDLGLNYTRNRNKILELDPSLEGDIIAQQYGVEMRLYEGRPLGDFYANDFLRDSLGRVIVNNNGIPNGTTEKSFAGNMNPNFIAGITSQISYKAFSLSATLDYRDGGVFWSYTKQLTRFVGNDPTTLYNDRRPFVMPNSVIPTGDGGYRENDIPIDMNDIFTYFNVPNNPGQERNMLLDRSYFKVRELTINYNMPESLLSKTPFNSVSASLVGRNLWLWTPTENNIVDPEATQFGNDLNGEFGEFAAGPSGRSFGFSVKLGI